MNNLHQKDMKIAKNTDPPLLKAFAIYKEIFIFMRSLLYLCRTALIVFLLWIIKQKTRQVFYKLEKTMNTSPVLP